MVIVIGRLVATANDPASCTHTRVTPTARGSEASIRPSAPGLSAANCGNYDRRQSLSEVARIKLAMSRGWLERDCRFVREAAAGCESPRAIISAYFAWLSVGLAPWRDFQPSLWRIQ